MTADEPWTLIHGDPGMGFHETHLADEILSILQETGGSAMVTVVVEGVTYGTILLFIDDALAIVYCTVVRSDGSHVVARKQLFY